MGNGQTGEISGESPVDYMRRNIVKILAWIKAYIPVFVVCVLGASVVALILFVIFEIFFSFYFIRFLASCMGLQVIPLILYSNKVRSIKKKQYHA